MSYKYDPDDDPCGHSSVEKVKNLEIYEIE